MFDVGWCGGLSEAKKIAAMAEAALRPIAPHDCTGPVVLIASLHLALNAPNALFQEVRARVLHGLVQGAGDGAASHRERRGLHDERTRPRHRAVARLEASTRCHGAA